MINLDEYSQDEADINTIFYDLDMEGLETIDSDFDISFIEHIRYGPIESIVVAEKIYRERDGDFNYGSDRIWFKWDSWAFSLTVPVWGVDHECPYCKCEQDFDYREAITERIDELLWELT